MAILLSHYQPYGTIFALINEYWCFLCGDFAVARYKSLIERVLRARLVCGSPNMNRSVSFEYMNRQLVWNEFSSLFNISNDPNLRKAFLSSVARRFADFKAKLVTGWITKTRKRTKKEYNREPYEIYKHMKSEDWTLFKKTRMAHDVVKIHERAIKSVKKNINKLGCFVLVCSTSWRP